MEACSRLESDMNRNTAGYSLPLQARKERYNAIDRDLKQDCNKNNYETVQPQIVLPLRVKTFEKTILQERREKRKRKSCGYWALGFA